MPHIYDTKCSVYCLPENICLCTSGRSTEGIVSTGQAFSHHEKKPRSDVGQFSKEYCCKCGIAIMCGKRGEWDYCCTASYQALLYDSYAWYGTQTQHFFFFPSVLFFSYKIPLAIPSFFVCINIYFQVRSMFFVSREPGWYRCILFALFYLLLVQLLPPSCLAHTTNCCPRPPTSPPPCPFFYGTGLTCKVY